MFPAPHLVLITRLAEVIGGVLRLRDVVLQINAHDQRGKDKRAGLDPVVAECPANQQISWAQFLVFPIFEAWYYGPIFEFDRWFLRSHAISSLDAWMQMVLPTTEAVFPDPAEISTLYADFLLHRLGVGDGGGAAGPRIATWDLLQWRNYG
jgi:hypothetical protein